MAFSVKILGSSSALPTSERFPTAHLVNQDERFFLIDCGEGTQIQLRKFSVRFGRINHIFISHLHGDHVFGLFGLISTFSLLGRKGNLHLYGPPMLEEIVRSHLRYFGQDMGYEILFHSVNHKEQELLYEDRKLTVHSIPLKHRIGCTGFLFREKVKENNIRKDMIERYQLGIADIRNAKKGMDIELENGEVIPNHILTSPPPNAPSYAFCTDTKYFDGVSEYVKNVDLLYFESTFLHSEVKLAKETYHSTAVQAATVALNAGVKKLVIGHFSSRYKNLEPLLNEAKAIFPNSALAHEGDEHNVSALSNERI